jgi:hypothetical protein
MEKSHLHRHPGELPLGGFMTCRRQDLGMLLPSWKSPNWGGETVSHRCLVPGRSLPARCVLVAPVDSTVGRQCPTPTLSASCVEDQLVLDLFLIQRRAGFLEVCTSRSSQTMTANTLQHPRCPPPLPIDPLPLTFYASFCSFISFRRWVN